MVTCVCDIPYGPDPRHRGDVHRAASAHTAGARIVPVLLIHGGGWNSLSKESLAPIARIIAERGHPVYSINYRLLSQAAFPACRDDCLAAARFVLDGGLERHGFPRGTRIIVCGASAGGHLAMLTGQGLGAPACAGIVSLAGPSRITIGRGDGIASVVSSPGFFASFFGTATPDEAQIASASPAAMVRASAPPLVCIHSRGDRLVPLAHSEEAVSAWHAKGVPARLLVFAGKGRQHGFWMDDDLRVRHPVPVLAKLLRRALTLLA